MAIVAVSDAPAKEGKEKHDAEEEDDAPPPPSFKKMMQLAGPELPLLACTMVLRLACEVCLKLILKESACITCVVRLHVINDPIEYGI